MVMQPVDGSKLRCEGCATGLVLDLAAGAVLAQGGATRRMTYVDDALAVWDCPACGHPDAADLAD